VGSTVLDVRTQDPRATDERPAPAVAPLRPRVIFALGTRRERLPLPEPRAVLGRGTAANVDIPHPSVSQRHCEIRREGAGFLVQDLGSTNGTRLGMQRLAGPQALPSGSQLILGEANLLFVHDGAAEPDAEAVFAELRGQRKLGRLKEAAARREVSVGRTPGEALVLVGALTPGEWIELAAAIEAGDGEPAAPRRLRAALIAALILALAILAWLLATR